MFLLIFLCFLSTFVNSEASFWDSSDPVLDLDQGLFELVLNSKDVKTTLETSVVFVVLFYAHWCSHCHHFKAKFLEAASTFHSDLRVKFLSVDCALYGDKCDEMKVSWGDGSRGG